MRCFKAGPGRIERRVHALDIARGGRELARGRSPRSRLAGDLARIHRYRSTETQRAHGDRMALRDASLNTRDRRHPGPLPSAPPVASKSRPNRPVACSLDPAITRLEISYLMISRAKAMGGDGLEPPTSCL